MDALIFCKYCNSKKQYTEFLSTCGNNLLRKKCHTCFDNKIRMINKNTDYHKTYYQTHKDVILKRQKQTIKCEACECMVRKNEFKKHERSKKHARKLKENSAIE